MSDNPEDFLEQGPETCSICDAAWMDCTHNEWDVMAYQTAKVAERNGECVALRADVAQARKELDETHDVLCRTRVEAATRMADLVRARMALQALKDQQWHPGCGSGIHPTMNCLCRSLWIEHGLAGGAK